MVCRSLTIIRERREQSEKEDGFLPASAIVPMAEQGAHLFRQRPCGNARLTALLLVYPYHRTSVLDPHDNDFGFPGVNLYIGN